MKAALMKGPRAKLEIANIQVPHPAAGELLVKINACGVCHTDVHCIDADWGKPTCNIPGHEGCGVVCQVGPGHSLYKVGDRVGIPWLHTACGVCEYCISGWETLCAKQKNAGFSQNGGLSEYSIASSSNCIPIPDDLSFTQAARKQFK